MAGSASREDVERVQQILKRTQVRRKFLVEVEDLLVTTANTVDLWIGGIKIEQLEAVVYGILWALDLN